MAAAARPRYVRSQARPRASRRLQTAEMVTSQEHRLVSGTAHTPSHSPKLPPQLQVQLQTTSQPAEAGRARGSRAQTRGAAAAGRPRAACRASRAHGSARCPCRPGARPPASPRPPARRRPAAGRRAAALRARVTNEQTMAVRARFTACTMRAPRVPCCARTALAAAGWQGEAASCPDLMPARTAEMTSGAGQHH